MCGKIGWCPAWNTQERRKEMILALEHLDRTVLMFDPVYTVESITPKACRRPEDWSNAGEMARIILGIRR
jgi:hypothetical protein